MASISNNEEIIKENNKKRINSSSDTFLIVNNKINSTTNLLSISLVTLASFMILFTYLENTENTIATAQNNQTTN